MTLRGRTALVTGGSRGIGKAITMRLAAGGAGDVRSAHTVPGTMQAPARPGTAADTAATVAFPNGGGAAVITGQQFTVDGGPAI